MSSSKAIAYKWTEKILKYTAEKIAECTSQQSLTYWSKEFLEEHKACPYAHRTLIKYAQSEFKTIEDLPYLNMIQKVQLLFVFSQTVSKKFEKILLEQGCKTRLDNERKIEYFQSADESFERSGNQDLGRRSLCRNKGPQPSLPQTNGQSTSAAGEPRAENVETRQNQQQRDQLPTNTDEQPKEEKPAGFDASAGRYEDFEDEEPLHLEQREYRREETAVKVKEEYPFNDEQRRAIEHFISVNYSYEIDINSRRDIESLFANGELLFPTIPRREDGFENNRRPDEPTTSTKRRQDTMPTEAKRLKQDDNGASTSGLMRKSGTSLGNFERRPTTSSSMRPSVAIPLRSSTELSIETSEQSFNRLHESSPSTGIANSSTGSSSNSSTPRVTPKLSVASITSANASTSVEVPKQDSSTQTCSVSSVTSTQATETDPLPEIKTISALQLAEQIETMAHSVGLKDLQQKAGSQVQAFEDQDMAICPKKFHRALAAIFWFVDEEKVESLEGESMKVLTFFERLKLVVIRPLGKELVANSMTFIEKRIKKLEGENNNEVLPLGKIKDILEPLLDLITF